MTLLGIDMRGRWPIATLVALLLASLLWPARGTVAPVSAAQCDPSNPDGCPLSPGVPELAALSVPGSSHLWLFDLTEPIDFTVDLLDPPIDVRLYGYAPDTTLLDPSDRPGRESEQLTVTTRQPGRYQLFVDSPRSEASSTPYVIVVTVSDPRALAEDEYEPDDSPLLANLLVPGESAQVHSFHHSADNDWVYLDLVAGGRIIIYTLGAGCDPALVLYATDGSTELSFDDDSGVGLNAQLDYLVEETGAYYVRALPSLRDPCGSYELAAEYRTPIPPDAYEPDDTPAQAKPLALDGVPQLHTAHNSQEQDWVTFSLSVGEGVRINTNGSCDTIIEVFGPDGGARVAFNDDGGVGRNAQVTFTASQAGVHYARVYQYLRSPCEGYELVGVRVAGGSETPAPPTPVAVGSTPVVVVGTAVITRPTPAPGEVVNPFDPFR